MIPLIGASALVFKCIDCGFAFKAREAVDYRHLPGSSFTAYEFDRSKEASQLLGILKREFKRREGLNVVEIGCGTGSLLLELRERGLHVFGFEPSGAAVRMARKKLGEELISEGFFNPKEIPLRPQVILLNDVIEHLDDSFGLFQQVSEVMDRNAVFLVKSGDPESLNAKLYPPKWSYFLDDLHVAFHTRKSLAIICSKSGLRLERFHKFRHAYGGFAFSALMRNVGCAACNMILGARPDFKSKFQIGLANDHFVAVIRKDAC